MTVKEIVARAQAFDFNPQIPLKHWLRTAAVLLREVCCTTYMVFVLMLTWTVPRRAYTRRKATTSRPICCSCDMPLLSRNTFRHSRAERTRKTEQLSGQPPPHYQPCLLVSVSSNRAYKLAMTGGKKLNNNGKMQPP